jgi:hypothetical protein
MKPSSEIVDRFLACLTSGSLLPILSTSHSCLVEAAQDGRVDSLIIMGVGKVTPQDTCPSVTARHLCLRSLFVY